MIVFKGGELRTTAAVRMCKGLRRRPGRPPVADLRDGRIM